MEDSFTDIVLLLSTVPYPVYLCIQYCYARQISQCCIPHFVYLQCTAALKKKQQKTQMDDLQ